MKIDICIPAYNEEKIIVEAAEAVQAALASLPGIEGSVIVADNGSTDRTAARAREAAGVMVHTISVRGKGAAIVGAARASQAEIFGFIDADLSADPADIATLLEPLLRSECDIAIGSRLLDGGAVKRERLRTFLSKVFNQVRKFALGISVQDTQCGLKLMNARGRNVLARCEETGWFFDMEFLARAERTGLRIREIPIRWNEHRFAERKSKLNLLRDGLGALVAIIRIARRLRGTANAPI